MDKPQAKALDIIIPAYRMHTQTFENVLTGVTEEDARERINGTTNHIIWMVGNLVNNRFWLAAMLGEDRQDPHEELFKDSRALDESLSYPTLATLKNEWHSISPLLYEKLLSVQDEALNESLETGMGIPFIRENRMNAIGMCIGREDYLFGQIGLMRRILGYKGTPMKFDHALKY